MARRQPAQHQPGVGALEITVNVDLNPPDLRAAMRAGMIQALAATQQEIRATMGAFFHGRWQGPPRKGGHAAEALRSKLFSTQSGFLGVTGWGPEHFYLHILEHGARAHLIRSREFSGRGRRRRRLANPAELKFAGPDGILFRRQVRHPGLRPRPFMATAARGVEPRVVAIFNQRIADAIAAQTAS